MNESILNKIRALRAKAQNAASTQAEVEAAAAAAAKLMVKHDLDESQITDAQTRSGAVEGAFKPPYQDIEEVIRYVFKGVETMTETKGYRDTINNDFRFIGLEPDVEMALYLFEMITQSAKRCWNSFVQSEFEAGRVAHKSRRPSFYIGFGEAIQAKLTELAEDRMAARSQAVGTALVIRKQDAIRDKMQEMGLTLRKGRTPRQSSVDPRAFSAGVTSANSVNLNRPFGANKPRGAIK